MTLAARRQAGPPGEIRCSICLLEQWLAENHPNDLPEHLAMLQDEAWSDRLHADALADEYGRPVSAQQIGVHRRAREAGRGHRP